MRGGMARSNAGGGWRSSLGGGRDSGEYAGKGGAQEEMKRIYKKNIWMNQRESDELKRKSQAACLSEAEFIRQLVMGYTPVTMPDEKFFRTMDIVRELADKIDAVAMKADNSVDMIAVMAEAKKWRMLQNAIEMEFLRPKRGDG